MEQFLKLCEAHLPIVIVLGVFIVLCLAIVSDMFISIAQAFSGYIDEPEFSELPVKQTSQDDDKFSSPKKILTARHRHMLRCYQCRCVDKELCSIYTRMTALYDAAVASLPKNERLAELAPAAPKKKKEEG
jgi:hypothetical protein